MHDESQRLLASVDHNNCGFCVVSVLVGVVVDFGGFFEVFEDGFGLL